MNTVMTAPRFDRVKELNKLSSELLCSHRESLARKNIRSRYQLIQAIELDLDKLTHALVEVSENQADRLLPRLVGQSAICADDIAARLADQRLYHVGFEIHEPLDLVLYGIDHWVRRSNQISGDHMRVRDYLRFPGSPALQKRVGAYTEIMRIWLEVRDQVLMLELFDIHRPIDMHLGCAPKPRHRSFDGLFQEPDGNAHEVQMATLFASDCIWHYAFHVRKAQDVADLHAELQGIIAGDPRYFLPYAGPVHNPHDNSFHTKIVKDGDDPSQRLELEFVTSFD